MLEKLGSALKKGFDRIAGAVFLDKKVVEEIVKDLQRALIQADVNIHLVKEIGERIKKEALNEKIKGIEKKEHLTKILHDEIINLLGKEKHELTIKKNKNTKIMLLGLYGAGKCVHGDSKIVLTSGEIISAEELYSNWSRKIKENELEDGKIIDITAEDLYVPSFNQGSLKIENKKVTHLWKLKKEELIEVKIDNGNDYSIKVTPEHPFFVLRNGKVKKIRADELSEDDYIAIPKEYKTTSKKISILKELKKLNFLVYLDQEEINKLIGDKKLKDICSSLNFKSNYCYFTHNIKKGAIPIELLKEDYNYLTIKLKGSKSKLTIPTIINEDFAEFLGYVIGDGHIEKRYVEITTEDIEVIERLKETGKNLFNLSPLIKKEKRSKNLYKIIFASKTLVEILKIFDLKKGKKGRFLKISDKITKSEDNIIKTFLRAYFDCDSYPALNRRNIEIISESQDLIKQVNILLKRFGINSTISKKWSIKNYYWRLFIRGKSAELYAEKIGYLIKRKRKKIEDYERLGIIQGSGKEDMIPVGKLLKDIRLSLGFSIGEIQEGAVYSYGIYERKGIISREKLLKLFNFYTKTKKGIFYKVLESIINKEHKINHNHYLLNNIIPIFRKENIIKNEEKNIILTERGDQILTQYQSFNSFQFLKKIESLSESHVYWSGVNKISKIKNDKEYVYDLTVEDNHSFIAEGFIVHNTTTTQKLALYYSKRGFKVCMISLDVHRPAAQDQLEQLGEKIKITTFIDKKEKTAWNIYEKNKREIEEYDLVIIDTAGRHNLDSELVEEVKNLRKKINPDHSFLVIQADIGQAAKEQAKAFQESCNINGVIITRMDSTAKAGGALTACNETNAPVYFIGTGEKPNEFETFDPEAFISRMLGLGDLKGLLERVESAIDSKSQKKLKEKVEKGTINLRDFQQQLDSMSSMGSLSKIIEMIPGLGKAKIPENVLGVQEDKIKKWKNAINSMTNEEIENPELIEKQNSRLKRIAKGSGTTTTDIRQLIKQYKLLKEMASGTGDLSNINPEEGLSQKQMQKLAKKFGKKLKL